MPDVPITRPQVRREAQPGVRVGLRAEPTDYGAPIGAGLQRAGMALDQINDLQEKARKDASVSGRIAAQDWAMLEIQQHMDAPDQGLMNLEGQDLFEAQKVGLARLQGILKEARDRVPADEKEIAKYDHWADEYLMMQRGRLWGHVDQQINVQRTVNLETKRTSSLLDIEKQFSNPSDVAFLTENVADDMREHFDAIGQNDEFIEAKIDEWRSQAYGAAITAALSQTNKAKALEEAKAYLSIDNVRDKLTERQIRGYEAVIDNIELAAEADSISSSLIEQLSEISDPNSMAYGVYSENAQITLMADIRDRYKARPELVDAIANVLDSEFEGARSAVKERREAAILLYKDRIETAVSHKQAMLVAMDAPPEIRAALMQYARGVTKNGTRMQRDSEKLPPAVTSQYMSVIRRMIDAGLAGNKDGLRSEGEVIEATSWLPDGGAEALQYLRDGGNLGSANLQTMVDTFVKRHDSVIRDRQKDEFYYEVKRRIPFGEKITPNLIDEIGAALIREGEVLNPGGRRRDATLFEASQADAPEDAMWLPYLTEREKVEIPKRMRALGLQPDTLEESLIGRPWQEERLFLRESTSEFGLPMLGHTVSDWQRQQTDDAKAVVSALKQDWDRSAASDALAASAAQYMRSFVESVGGFDSAVASLESSTKWGSPPAWLTEAKKRQGRLDAFMRDWQRLKSDPKYDSDDVTRWLNQVGKDMIAEALVP